MQEFEEENDDEGFFLAERPNKSANKRECLEMEALGEELAALTNDRLLALELPEKLLGAIQEAQKLSHGSALKRQRKFIGKLLRNTEDIEPIQARLAHYKQLSALSIHDQHRVEQWRDKLVAGDTSAVNELLENWPEADRQKIRQLVRDAKKEQALAAPPKSARLLFRYLRELMLQSEDDT
jgi:ribosome-associated protein